MSVLTPDELTAELNRVLEVIDCCEETDEANAAWLELVDLCSEHPEILPVLKQQQDELQECWNGARGRLAHTSAQLAGIVLALSEPAPTADAHPEFAVGGPATEIALSAFYCLRNAGEMVLVDAEEIQAALQAPDAEPDYSDYEKLFACTVAHLQTAAYYLLNPVDSHASLASEPPTLDTFPPLPFPRIWVEMTHLAPFMRFIRKPEHRKEGSDAMDILGIGIAEIQQGAVWDIYAPFVLGNRSEFFILGARIGPNGIVASDASIEGAPYGFAHLRNLAIGAAHLITARNVHVPEVQLPRHQRKRLAQIAPLLKPRLYYVDLASSGEHSSGTGDREYTVRWLVRGHWRHVPGGKRYCTCCQPQQVASWVEPYIKGPAGAPWKGRQVRRSA